jgi:hypothetical protein
VSALLTPYTDAEIAERVRAMRAAEDRRAARNCGDSWANEEKNGTVKKHT